MHLGNVNGCGDTKEMNEEWFWESVALEVGSVLLTFHQMARGPATS